MPPAGEGSSDRLEAALKAERDARKKAEKELSDARRKQDEGLTETERLARRVAELEAANKAAEREALVLRIATETGLPPLLAARLQGEDETSLREDAQRLKPLIQAPAPTTVGGPQGPPPSTRTPEEWLSVIRGKR
jgi:hypothetical protein